MAYIRRYYGVPAKRGGQVKYSGGEVEQLGTIRSARGASLMVQLEGRKLPARLHPTWKVEYL